MPLQSQTNPFSVIAAISVLKYSDSKGICSAFPPSSLWRMHEVQTDRPTSPELRVPHQHSIQLTASAASNTGMFIVDAVDVVRRDLSGGMPRLQKPKQKPGVLMYLIPRKFFPAFASASRRRFASCKYCCMWGCLPSSPRVLLATMPAAILAFPNCPDADIAAIP